MGNCHGKAGGLPQRISYVSGLKPGPTCSLLIGLFAPQLSIEEQDLHINGQVLCYILRGNKPLVFYSLALRPSIAQATGERVL